MEIDQRGSAVLASIQHGLRGAFREYPVTPLATHSEVSHKRHFPLDPQG